MKIIFCLVLFFSITGLPTSTFANQKIPILVYHSIEEYKGTGSKELYVTPKNFEQQISYLKKHGFTLLTFERWHDRNKVNKPIFITIDDGYKNAENAFSIFEKLSDQSFHPTGTIFVISDFIGRSGRLTPSNLKKMSASGFFSIQSHTATHPDLTKTQDFVYQLKQSKEKIEAITEKPVNAISYPYGNFNNRVVDETRKYYQFGLTTTPGPYVETGLKNENYVLPRTYVKYSTSIEQFEDIVNENE